MATAVNSGNDIGSELFRIACEKLKAIPWEDLLVGYAPSAAAGTTFSHTRPTRPTQVPSPKATTSPAASALAHVGPGCTAADNAGVALYHLEGLASGKPNFGVLRVSKQRLEEGAQAAEKLGKSEIAREMRGIAAEMPNIRDAEAARGLADKLKPVAYSAWDLGAKCKGSLTIHDIKKVREMAHKEVLKASEVSKSEGGVHAP